MNAQYFIKKPTTRAFKRVITRLHMSSLCVIVRCQKQEVRRNQPSLTSFIKKTRAKSKKVPESSFDKFIEDVNSKIWCSLS